MGHLSHHQREHRRHFSPRCCTDISQYKVTEQHDAKIKVLITVIIALLFPN